MTPLRAKMIHEMRLRRFAHKTQKAYISAVADLARFYNSSPDQIDSEKIKAYLVYLEHDRKLSWSTCNVAAAGLRFFYTQVLGNEAMDLFIPRRKKQKKIPEILTFNEVERLFVNTGRAKHRVLLMTTYAGGLRVSEVVRLKITDIDSERMTIRVEQGKGNKDRYTILSSRLLEELRMYWRMCHPKTWLFPSTSPERHVSIETAQRIYYQAKLRAGIKKGKGIHTLRHCFATHLLEQGTDPRTIQTLLGHRSIITTMTYMQVTQKRLLSIKSPLDLIQIPKDMPHVHEDQG